MAEACNIIEDTELLEGQVVIQNFIFAYTDSMALRSAVELGIADIIHSNGQPMGVSQIASKIDSPSLDVTFLNRVMRVLARKKIFTVDYSQSSGDQALLYGLTPASKWILRDFKLSLAANLMTFTHPWIMGPWHEMGRSIKEGSIPFEKAYGLKFWEKASVDKEFNDLFNSGMVSATKPHLSAILNGYKDGFSQIEGTLVDVGGGFGAVVAEIVKANPRIQGINFDLPHVVEAAPQYPNVTHVGGDMTKEIPKANAVFIKSVLHNWADEDCIKILKNCQKAILQKEGKVIIADIVLNPEGKGLFEDTKFALDLLMAVGAGGKERTEHEWKTLLKEAGFVRYNFITLPALVSIIEAFTH